MFILMMAIDKTGPQNICATFNLRLYWRIGLALDPFAIKFSVAGDKSHKIPMPLYNVSVAGDEVTRYHGPFAMKFSVAGDKFTRYHGPFAMKFSVVGCATL
jgi:hypothetical protein